MPAFVGTDAAKALRVLEPFDMLLNRATGNKFLQRPKDHVEHEVDKGAGIARLLRGMKRLVVSALVAQYHVLYRQGIEERIPPAEYHSLPKSPHPPVAVGKRMDRLEDKMEYAALHQRSVL